MEIMITPIPVTTYAIVVPHSDSSRSQQQHGSQQAASGCTYSVQVDSYTNRCYSEEEYQKYLADEQAEFEERNRNMIEWLKQWWWAVTIAVVLFIKVAFFGTRDPYDMPW